MPQLVFLSLFLGLVAGVQQIDLRADPSIKSIRISLGARELATLQRPPWHAVVDFGADLVPRELTAVGFDSEGNEVARTTQVVNLKRPLAEVAISVKQENGEPAVVELTGRHLQFIQPDRATVRVDDQALRMEGFTAHLPNLDPKRPHVISAEMRFQDGAVARREVVLTGWNSYLAGSEMTPVVITRTSEKKAAALDGCFSVDRTNLNTGTVERTNALVVFVKDPDASEAQKTLRLSDMMMHDGLRTRRETTLDADSTIRVVWPITQEFKEGNAESVLFENSNDLDALHMPVSTVLAMRFPVRHFEDKPRQFADAVAVAGLQTILPARRRAVVLVLSDEPDKSIYKPAVVRRYLQSIGVPLFVWSLSGPRPDLADSWGEVLDVSRHPGLRDAVSRLRETLDRQCLVWLPVDALTALRVEAKASCGVSVVPRP
ncbi:MAG TPA: hypothetical protein VLV78_11075 [Thermoanaerobaculia bacterium]|nr:hypothetical protein [Thermoanaerobaculia bacterium]